MLSVSQGTSPSIDEAKPEAQATSQTNLGTGIRASAKSAFSSFESVQDTMSDFFNVLSD
jgi:hypothetical protein